MVNNLQLSSRVCGSKPSSIGGNSFQFILPESLEIGEALPTKLHHRLDDMMYAVSTIMRKTSRGMVDRNGYVTLNAGVLGEVMHANDRRAVFDAMIERGIIERDYYLVGKKSYGYRVNEKYSKDRHTRVAATDRRLIKAKEKSNQALREQRQGRWLPIHDELERQQRRLGIDLEEAREIIAGLDPKRDGANKFDRLGIQAEDIFFKRFRMTVSQYGRVFNNETSLKKELRAALRFKGEPLSLLDIKNSQPTLLARELWEHRGPIEATTHGCTIYDSRFGADMEHYCHLTSTGVFYNVFVEMLREAGFEFKGDPRDQTKRRFLVDVLAKAKLDNGGEYPSLVEAVFAKHFPSVYEFIREFNCAGEHHSNLIRFLQRAEADLVIHEVAADLMKNTKALVVTIHDAILCGSKDTGIVKSAFKRAFDRQGFEMTIDQEKA